jgi:hypothetical protein
MSNQPYRFSGGNPAGSLAQSIGGFIAGGLKQRGGVHEKMMEHEMRIRENAIATVVKSQARRDEMKTQGKQVRKNIAAQGEADVNLSKVQGKQSRKEIAAQGKSDIKVSNKKLKGMVKASGKMGDVVEPGTKVDMSRDKFNYTAKKPAAPVAPTSTPRARKSISRPSIRGGNY